MDDPPGSAAKGDQIQIQVNSEDLVKKMKDSKSFDKLKVKILQNMQTNVCISYLTNASHSTPLVPTPPPPPPLPPPQEALIQIVDDFICNTDAAKSGNPGRINDEIRSNKTIDDLRPHVLEAIWAEMCRPESNSSHYIDHELLLAMCAMEDEIDEATIEVEPPPIE
jgi:hypothetical protein